VGGQGCAAAAFSTFGGGGAGEEGDVVARGGVGGEVGG